MKAYFDVHTHNYLSRCCHERRATAESYVDRAAELGLSILGISNHCWDERAPFPVSSSRSAWYYAQSLAFAMQVKTQIPEDTHGVRVLIGVETEYCGMYDALGMTPEGARQLDYLLVPHSHTHMRDFVMPQFPDLVTARENAAEKLEKATGVSPERAAALAAAIPDEELGPFMPENRTDQAAFLRDFLVKSFDGLMENKDFKTICGMIPVSVAHPFQPVGSGRLREEILAGIDDGTFCRLFEKTAALGAGLEINGNCADPQLVRMNRLAKACGCRFTLGSDTHSAEGMSGIFKTEAATEAAGVTQDDIMEFFR